MDFTINHKITEISTRAIIKYLLEEDIDVSEPTKILFLEILEENEIKICSRCGSIMIEGYCIEGGMEYYCDDECFFTNGYTKEQWQKDYTDEGDSYWTEWDTILSYSKNDDLYKNINLIISKYPSLGLDLDKNYK